MQRVIIHSIGLSMLKTIHQTSNHDHPSKREEVDEYWQAAS
jgi:hypothetical protein